MSKKRAVCLNCIDGCAQLPVINFIKAHHPVDYVDMITKPGMDGLLADDGADIGPILKKIRLSISKNNAYMIFVVGHCDCRGNPVSDAEHQGQVRSGVRRLQKIFEDIDILGLWVTEKWEGQII